MTSEAFSSDAPMLRLGGTLQKTSTTLGPLADLVGTWVGNGVNMVAVPAIMPDDKLLFKLLLRPYAEILTFTPVGAPVPNRGGAVEQFVGALMYELRIWDLETNVPLHAENGMWLNLQNILPADTEPVPKYPIVRQASIPHGDVIMAPGTFRVQESGQPTIPKVSGNPCPLSGPDESMGYDDIYSRPSDFPIVGEVSAGNPGVILQRRLSDEGQRIDGFTELNVSTGNGGGIFNVPFVQRHAAASSFEAWFWIEKATASSKQPFLQLQYLQRTNLEFLKIIKGKRRGKLVVWPHINANTLLKQ